MIKLNSTEKGLLLLSVLLAFGARSTGSPALGYGAAISAAVGLGSAATRNAKPLPVEEQSAAKHGQAFLDQTRAIETRLGMPRGTLTSIMFSESGLNPQAQEPRYGGGGLIGFMPATTRGYGISQAELLSLSASQQLEYVEKFYSNWLAAGKQPKDEFEWYLLTFYPAAVGQGTDYVIGAPGSNVYNANSSLDYNKDGTLTVEDFYNHLKHKERLKGTIFQQ